MYKKEAPIQDNRKLLAAHLLDLSRRTSAGLLWNALAPALSPKARPRQTKYAAALVCPIARARCVNKLNCQHVHARLSWPTTLVPLRFVARYAVEL